MGEKENLGGGGEVKYGSSSVVGPVMKKIEIRTSNENYQMKL